MESYTLAKKTMPETRWNTRFYNTAGNYVHDANGAFWASSFVTPDTFPKEYLNTFPLDPQTNHYYAYGRRYDGVIGYEFATILNDSWEYSTYLRGNYDGSVLASLIKEAQWPNFVDDGTVKYLPYNPEELKLTGRIYFMSGSVKIDTGNGIPVPIDIKNPIGQGDKITVEKWWNTTIYLSDWSEIEIGSQTSDTTIDFNTLKYKENNNLSSQVESILTLGEVWVRAPRYYKSSDFSIQSDGQVATVRGTVFWMTRTGSGKTFTLAQGIINIEPKDIWDYRSKIMDPTRFTGSWFIPGNYQSGSLLMDANKSEKPITFDEPCAPGTSSLWQYCYISSPNIYASWSTGATLTKANTVLDVDIWVHSGRIPNIVSIDKNLEGILSLDITNFWANEIEITTLNSPSPAWSISDPIIQTWSTLSNTLNFVDVDNRLREASSISLRLCYDPSREANTGKWGDRICSATKIIDISPTPTPFSFSGSNITPPKDSTGPVLCALGKVFWTWFGCEDENLIAYANYIRPGDIFLYNRNGGTFPIASSANIISSGALIWDALEQNLLGETREWPIREEAAGYAGANCVPAWSDSGNTFQNYTCNGDIKNLNKNWVLYQTGSSFFGFPDRTGGIFINNSPTLSGSLAYDLKDQLGDKFAIEIGMRGAALKNRTSGIYTLWSDNASNNLYLRIDNGNLKLKIFGYIITNNTCWMGDNNNTFCIPFSTLTDIEYDNNVFVRVTNIPWESSITVSSPTKTYFKSPIDIIKPSVTFSQPLYIWSSKSPDAQWNDLITTLKISK